jgi:two-component system response regulator NreC
MTTRILIADDHGVLRAGLRALLAAEPDFEVVGEATTGREVVDLAPRLQPEVVLMDISMPDVDGIVATRALAVQLPQVRVLLLTVHEDEALLREGIRAGAAGYIVKRAVESELINAIRSVARGDLYVHPSMTRALLEDAPPRTSRASRISDLTPRETEVLSLIALGYTNRQVAERLQISTRTVESHRANLMAKLGLRSRAQLVRYAVDHGLLGI